MGYSFPEASKKLFFHFDGFGEWIQNGKLLNGKRYKTTVLQNGNTTKQQKDKTAKTKQKTKDRDKDNRQRQQQKQDRRQRQTPEMRRIAV